MQNEPYDPLDYENLANSVVRALMEQPPCQLPPPESFTGPGVYAIYYAGDMACYAPLVRRKHETPIYVGKAIPAGARKGRAEQEPSGGTPLFTRLSQHARSIEQAENLALDEFRCRYLVVVPVWVGLAERFLISHFQPVWNTVLDGFGNHDPGKGRRAGARPRWDIVHPGRAWAAELEARERQQEITAEVQRHLKTQRK